MMLMIIEISSNLGIWEPLLQTVNVFDYLDVCFTYAHLIALSCTTFFTLFCLQVYVSV